MSKLEQNIESANIETVLMTQNLVWTCLSLNFYTDWANLLKTVNSHCFFVSTILWIFGSLSLKIIKTKSWLCKMQYLTFGFEFWNWPCHVRRNCMTDLRFAVFRKNGFETRIKNLPIIISQMTLMIQYDFRYQRWRDALWQYLETCRSIMRLVDVILFHLV